MKNIKILIAILITGLLLIGCGDTKSADALSIGVIQFASHEALDDSFTGFIEGLEELGLIENQDYYIDFQNAQGDTATLETIAEKMVNSKHDLIYAIATPAAQAVANKTSDIPIVVAAVTNPEEAGLVLSNDDVGLNVTGVSDLTPVKRQIELLKEIAPNTNKIAVMYANSEDNSRFQAKLAKEIIEDLGMEYVDASVSEASQIIQMSESLINKVDAIYVPTDNLVSESFTTVSEIANSNNILTVVGEIAMVRKGGLITDGISYLNGGKKVSEIVYDILINNIEVSDIPIVFMEESDLELAINKHTLKILDLNISEEISNKAVIVE